MTQTTTVSEYVKLARDAIAAGDFAAAETATNQAKAIKALGDLEPRVDATQRLPFGSSSDDAQIIEQNAKSAALKAWFAQATSTKGDIDSNVKTVLDDMYGGNYLAARYAKSADFLRYLRTGNYDPALKSAVVYLPEQVMADLAGGMTVADLKSAMKATQVESQDTSGGLAKAA